MSGVSASLSAHLQSQAAGIRRQFDSFSSKAQAATLEGASALVASLGDSDSRVRTIQRVSEVLGAPAGTVRLGRRQTAVCQRPDRRRHEARPPQEFLGELAVAAVEDLREEFERRARAAGADVETLRERVNAQEGRPVADPAFVARLQGEALALREGARIKDEQIAWLQARLGHLHTDPDSLLRAPAEPEPENVPEPTFDDVPEHVEIPENVRHKQIVSENFPGVYYVKREGEPIRYGVRYPRPGEPGKNVTAEKDEKGEPLETLKDAVRFRYEILLRTRAETQTETENTEPAPRTGGTASSVEEVFS